MTRAQAKRARSPIVEWWPGQAFSVGPAEHPFDGYTVCIHDFVRGAAEARVMPAHCRPLNRAARDLLRLVGGK